jgi:threonine/homoserine/homoserine lactone efflux protein
MFEMFILSIVFMAITLIIFIMYGILANRVRKHVINSPRMIVWLQRSFAATFAALGVKLAMTDQ